jgi:hypothetical protein
MVAFVTLHVLEVLDEQWLSLCLCLFAVELDKFIIGPQAAQLLLNEVALLHIDGHDPQRWQILLGRFAEMAHKGDRLFGHRRRLGRIAPRAVGAIDAHELDRKSARSSHRKCDQAAVVELPVREGDETLAAAAIVPFESPALAKALLAGFQNRRRIDVIVVIVLRPGGRLHAGEEVSGRKLLGVADDDDLLSAEHAPESVLGTHLRCFVDHKEVELQVPRRHELGERERRHHKAGLQRLDCLSGPGKKLPNRSEALDLGELVAEQPHFRPGLPWPILRTNRRGGLEQLGPDGGAVGHDLGPVALGERSPTRLEQSAVVRGEPLGLARCGRTAFGDNRLEECGNTARLDGVPVAGGQKLRQSDRVETSAEAAQRNELCEFLAARGQIVNQLHRSATSRSDSSPFMAAPDQHRSSWHCGGAGARPGRQRLMLDVFPQEAVASAI